MTTKIHPVEGKKQMVREMFNDIAPRYDLLNHVLSANIDKIWRKKVRRLIGSIQPEIILDVATGTGDLALELAKLPVKEIVGIDIAADMLEVGKVKVKNKGLEHVIQMQVGDSESIQFEDNYFDAVSVAFGVRNYENLPKGLDEMCRVLRPGGVVAVLEFSKPAAFPMKQLYRFYFNHILPVIGKVISKNSSAYTYLPNSVAAFPEGEVFMAEMQKAGFKDVKQQRLSFGIATLYSATK